MCCVSDRWRALGPVTEQVFCYSAPVCVPPASSSCVCVERVLCFRQMKSAWPSNRADLLLFSSCLRSSSLIIMCMCVERVLCFRQMKSAWPINRADLLLFSSCLRSSSLIIMCVCVLAAGLWLGVIHHIQDEDEGGPLLWRVCLLSLCLSRCVGFTAAELHIKSHFSFHTHHNTGPQRQCERVCVCFSHSCSLGIKMFWKTSEINWQTLKGSKSIFFYSFGFLLGLVVVLF